MQQDELRRLLRRYANGTCSKQEKRFLEDLVLRNPVVGNWKWNSEEERALTGIRIKQAIDEKRLAQRRPRKIKWRYASIAASLLIALGISWYLRPRFVTQKVAPVVINETAPYPSDGIRLTLADGSVIDLDNLNSGLISHAGEVQIRKLVGGQLVYEISGAQNTFTDDEPIPQNTIHVPNGKQFQLTLPDGTIVWMNTASTLTYPVAFTGGERRVVLNGEAYFEVAHDPSVPFKVTAHGTEITVTGTRFNISAYLSDKTVTTTLLEGGVAVRHGRQQVALTPGYQAIVNDKQGLEKQRGNIDQAMAWKNGYFMFDGMDVLSVMRSVARWYDIQIEVTGDIPPKRFGGTFPVTAELDELLADLEMVGKMKFERKGKEVRIIW